MMQDKKHRKMNDPPGREAVGGSFQMIDLFHRTPLERENARGRTREQGKGSDSWMPSAASTEECVHPLSQPSLRPHL